MNQLRYKISSNGFIVHDQEGETRDRCVSMVEPNVTWFLIIAQMTRDIFFMLVSTIAFELVFYSKLVTTLLMSLLVCTIGYMEMEDYNTQTSSNTYLKDTDKDNNT